MGAPAPLSDEELFLRFRDGDEAALAPLLERHRVPLRAMIARRIPSRLSRRISASDVLQDTELLVFRNGRVFEDRGVGSFKRWLYGIAENRLREAIRYNGRTEKRAADREVSRGDRPDTGELAGDRRSPSRIAMSKEFATRVRVAMSALPSDYRRILRLTRETGLTLAEAAAEMGRSREAIKKLYGRAFCRFREEYVRRFGHEEADSDASPDGP